jgi:hypothetical protein
MACGVTRRWQFPIAYYLTASAVQSSSIIEILKSVINLLESEGFIVLGITSDQGSNFEKAFKYLGCSHTKPTIELGAKSYFVYKDPPHLLKNSRNLLLRSDVSVPGFKDAASRKHIVTLFEKEKMHSLKMVPKLSDTHLSNLRFSSKMKVKLAALVLSNSVAAALDTGLAQTTYNAAVAATSSYCKKINDIFDVLNFATPKCSVPLRRPISTNSEHFKFLHEFLPWLQELQNLNAKKRCSFINGWIQSINVILQLRVRLDEHNLPYLSTRNVCQDGLECFFGKIRLLQKVPDARNFADNYAKIASSSLLRAPLSANCQNVEEQLDGTLVHFSKVNGSICITQFKGSVGYRLL